MKRKDLEHVLERVSDLLNYAGIPIAEKHDDGRMLTLDERVMLIIEQLEPRFHRANRKARNMEISKKALALMVDYYESAGGDRKVFDYIADIEAVIGAVRKRKEAGCNDDVDVELIVTLNRLDGNGDA